MPKVRTWSCAAQAPDQEIHLSLWCMSTAPELGILLAHQAGGAGRLWTPVAEELAQHGLLVIAPDLRGHGRSTNAAPGETYHYDGFAADVLAAVSAAREHAPLRAVLGAGNSIGATAILRAQMRDATAFAGLWLHEPIALMAEPELKLDSPWVQKVATRADQFEDMRAAEAALSRRPNFTILDDEVQALYLQNCLEQNETGVQLCCRSAVEAAIFAQGYNHDTFARLDGIQVPTHVVRGEGELVVQRAGSQAMVDRIPGAVLTETGLSHNGPFEDPAWCAASILEQVEMLAAQGVLRRAS